jgi:hypothetical protein
MEALGANVILVVLASNHTVVFDCINTFYSCGIAHSNTICNRNDHPFNKKTI